MSNLFNEVYNPDVLECLANLSNDEVFTPPDVANQMIDLLPEEIFSNPDIKFLDPACKSGVFLREIAKRLIVGLEDVIPDYKERLDHIYHNQLYGIAITELTSLMSRRSLYYTKYPQTEFSVSKFDNPEGNIIFHNINHTWNNKRCKYCGATRASLDRGEELETHAYEFIHTYKPGEIFDMKFDVIIGNPPYNLDDGGAGASASPIYQFFIEQAIKLNPNYLVMITPSRWFSGGKGLDDFRKFMLNSTQIREIHDFLDASDCFPGVEIKGGVNYFLWDRNYSGDCKFITYKNNKVTSERKRPLKSEDLDIVIRYNESIDILNKVLSFKEESFEGIVSSRKPFGLPTNFKSYHNNPKKDTDIKVYATKLIGWVSNDFIIPKNKEWVDKWKIFVPKAIGSGNISTDEIKPILGEPNSISTETYILIGPFDSKKETKNVYSYIRTKFFHFLMGLRKVTQDATAKVYRFIPMQDFSKSWTDEELYSKYNLNSTEINYIENIIQLSE